MSKREKSLDTNSGRFLAKKGRALEKSGDKANEENGVQKRFSETSASVRGEKKGLGGGKFLLCYKKKRDQKQKE